MGSKTERFYKIELMIRHRGQVSFDEMLAALEVSRATLKRDLQFLRDRMGAPIVYDRAENAYRFADDLGAIDSKVTSTSCRGCGSTRRSCMRC